MITAIGLLQLFIYLLTLLLLVKPVGWYIAGVYQEKFIGLQWFESFLYRICRIDPKRSMDWKQYLIAMLIFNMLGMLIFYALQRFQAYLPLNPQHFSATPTDLTFNNAISFVTNTDWQAYSGETTLSYFTQMVALTSQNFFSAATGLSLAITLIRGISGHESHALGNFWVDIVRGVFYILLPLALIFACLLVSQGVIQNFKPNLVIQPLELSHAIPDPNATDNTLSQQTIPMGPVASLTAIAQLGTNGGGFFNTNMAHPFANPTPLTNFFAMLAILLLPASLCYTYGVMVSDKRQGWAILITMVVIFIPFLMISVAGEQTGNPLLEQMNIEQHVQNNDSSGGNMEGKETRFGIVSSALWTVATTAASNGSVNSMLDSYTPLGGLIPLWMMHLGEVIFGGVGTGLNGLLMFVIVAVFVAGLMVGRTPEYLGKKIEPYEMKMASMAVLVMPMFVLLFTALASVTVSGTQSIMNPGAHGFTEMLYAMTSMGNNNGSAFAGLNANTLFYNALGGFLMLVGRYWIAIPVLAIAGSLAKKKIMPSNVGTLATHTPLFIVLLISVTLILGGLSFLPALALGPIVEQLMIWKHYVQ
jgi:K+-transporting ATPase ATPase A chain